MEIVLVVLAFFCLLVGLLGSVVPALPGPPVSYVGLLLLQWSGYGGFSVFFLIVWAAITIIVIVADNILPAWMTKRFGGSRIAVVGSILGLIAGMIFFAPVGLIAGPFLGALAGELINMNFKKSKTDFNAATDSSAAVAGNSDTDAKPLKAALGAFLAFIMGTGAKLIICSMMIYYSVRAMFS